jgi:hypothetical protein
MTTFYGTFGTGQEYAGCYIEIHAQDMHCARTFMIKAHGQRWSSVYTAEQFAGQAERYGLMRLAVVHQRPTEPRDAPYFDIDRSAA